mmetsp:Transcript_77917/g.200600  ORF Transcript_77917/g.200600 Transcript_77917/m.200600 type:complete len:308 (-) Transcript_77917:258-1181(-)
MSGEPNVDRREVGVRDRLVAERPRPVNHASVVVHEPRAAAAVQDVAGVVERDVERADGLRVLPGLHHAHLFAVAVGQLSGVIAQLVPAHHRQALVAQEAVRVAADDDVDAAQRRHHGGVLLVADVREQNDLVHARGNQHVNLRLCSGGLVGQRGAMARRGGAHGLHLHVDADDADPLTVQGLDRRLLNQALQWRGRARDHVGAQHGRLATERRVVVEVMDEVGQRLVARIELVVAHLEGIEAHVRHHVRVRHAPEEREVRGARHGVASVELHDAGALGLSLLHQVLKPADQAVPACVVHAHHLPGGR